MGAIAPNLGLAPKCDIKHCSTNSSHWHIGKNTSIVWPSKYAKMHLCARVAQDTPRDPLVGWGGDTPPHILPYSAQNNLGGMPQLFLSKPHLLMISHFNSVTLQQTTPTSLNKTIRVNTTVLAQFSIKPQVTTETCISVMPTNISDANAKNIFAD